jgi:hypothetical protein
MFDYIPSIFKNYINILFLKKNIFDNINTNKKNSEKIFFIRTIFNY